MTRVVDPLDLAVTYTYDGKARLSEVEAPDGGVTTIDYGAGGVTTTEPGNRVVTLDVAGKLLGAIHDADTTTHLPGPADAAADPVRGDLGPDGVQRTRTRSTTGRATS